MKRLASISLSIIVIFSLFLVQTASATVDYQFISLKTSNITPSIMGINEVGQIIFTMPKKPGHISYLWDKGEFIELGNLGRSSTTYPRDINEPGQIVGESVTTYGETHGFLWKKGVMTDLGTLGGPESRAEAINNHGQIIGFSNTDYSDYTQTHAFLWEKGVMTDLGMLPGGYESVAVDINNRGQIIGYTLFYDAETDVTTVRCFLWEHGVMTDIGSLGGWDVVVTDINELGQIVGNSLTADGARHAFLWEKGTMIDLGTLGEEYQNSEARRINNQGQIIGFSYADVGPTHGFLWEKGQMIDLGTQGGISSSAFDINERGQIVGSFVLDEISYPFLWQNGEMIKLPALDMGTNANWINNKGQIVGTGRSLNTIPPSHVLLWEKSGGSSPDTTTP